MLLDDRKPEIKLEPELDEVGLLLLRAADHIEANGWCQGQMSRRGAHCAMGAINHLASQSGGGGGDWGHWRQREGAEARLHTHLTGQTYSSTFNRTLEIACWNDDPSQTMENVVQTMREAAFATR